MTLHPATEKLIDDFAVALKAKLLAAQEKYGYQTNWFNSAFKADCLSAFKDHIAKGDPLDVAGYCAFMWHHGWKTVADKPVRRYPVWPKCGDKMYYLNFNGYDLEKERGFATFGEARTMLLEVEAFELGSSSSSIKFVGIEGWWNSVMFEFEDGSKNGWQ